MNGLDQGATASNVPEKSSVPGFQTRSHTNQAVLLQNMARGLKFRI